MRIRAVEWNSDKDNAEEWSKDHDAAGHDHKVVGQLYVPEGTGPFAGIVLCHGFAGVKELLPPAYAERFAAAGFAALTFDYRGFGGSGGERGRILPEQQVSDILSAIEFLRSQPEIFADRVALWGTSLGGANAVVAASREPGIKCLTVQLTFADGERVVTGKMSDQEKAKLLSTIQRLQDRRAKTGRETMVSLADVLTDPQSAAFYERFADHPALDIEVPMLTVAETLKYKPAAVLADVKVPILVVGAGKDSVNPPQESVLLFQAANEPKSLMMLDEATHYELYEGDYLDQVSTRQIEWFEQYL